MRSFPARPSGAAGAWRKAISTAMAVMISSSANGEPRPGCSWQEQRKVDQLSPAACTGRGGAGALSAASDREQLRGIALAFDLDLGRCALNLVEVDCDQ